VAAFWECGCLGVEVGARAVVSAREPLALRACFPGARATGTARARLVRALRSAGVLRTGSLRLAVLIERPWVRRWRSSLRPMAIGRRILVLPEGCRKPRRLGRVPIRVRLGQAFGTGEHASTRLSLGLLESCLRRGERVADLGTGTGILAMAASLLGARSVLAVDDDRAALGVARACLRDNGLSGRVTLRREDAGRACRRGPFDVATVNIGATVIGRILRDLSGALSPGGRAVLAGFLVEDEAFLLKHGRTCGLRLVERRRSPPWSALLLERARGRRAAALDPVSPAALYSPDAS
jgi:ribosomal protein L11 methyltransferase